MPDLRVPIRKIILEHRSRKVMRAAPCGDAAKTVTGLDLARTRLILPVAASHRLSTNMRVLMTSRHRRRRTHSRVHRSCAYLTTSSTACAASNLHLGLEALDCFEIRRRNDLARHLAPSNGARSADNVRSTATQMRKLSMVYLRCKSLPPRLRGNCRRSLRKWKTCRRTSPVSSHHHKI